MPSQVWEVSLITERQRYFLKTLGIEGAINIWKEQSSLMDIMVEGHLVPIVAGMLHEQEIPYSVAIKDVASMVTKELSPSGKGAKSVGKKHLDWKAYYSLDVIYDFLDYLKKQYPNLCELIVIGKTSEGREIKVLKVSNGRKDNVGVWIDGGIHAREWISPAVVTYMADQLLRRFNTYSNVITHKDWYILPVLNPDGYVYTFEHDRMWRKNRARFGELVGVDLNRNFGHGWGKNGEDGSSEDPGSIFYRGPKPFSEPETEAVRKLIKDSGCHFKVFVSFHSYGEVILFPWGHTSEPCRDYVELLQGGSAMAKAIQETSGRTYKVGGTKDLMYYAAGNSIDWSYGDAKIPYSFIVELRGNTHKFLLPKEDILITCKEAKNAVFRLLDFVDNKCRKQTSCISCSSYDSTA